MDALFLLRRRSNSITVKNDTKVTAAIVVIMMAINVLPLLLSLLRFGISDAVGETT